MGVPGGAVDTNSTTSAAIPPTVTKMSCLSAIPGKFCSVMATSVPAKIEPRLGIMDTTTMSGGVRYVKGEGKMTSYGSWNDGMMAEGNTGPEKISVGGDAVCKLVGFREDNHELRGVRELVWEVEEVDLEPDAAVGEVEGRAEPGDAQVQRMVREAERHGLRAEDCTPQRDPHFAGHGELEPAAGELRGQRHACDELGEGGAGPDDARYNNRGRLACERCFADDKARREGLVVLALEELDPDRDERVDGDVVGLRRIGVQHHGRERVGHVEVRLADVVREGGGPDLEHEELGGRELRCGED
eukprot:36150-Rhodomonas_salina.5